MTGKDLKAWRLRLGLKQTEAAELLLTPYQTYCMWERTSPRPVVVLACAWIEHQQTGLSDEVRELIAKDLAKIILDRAF